MVFDIRICSTRQGGNTSIACNDQRSTRFEQVSVLDDGKSL